MIGNIQSIKTFLQKIYKIVNYNDNIDKQLINYKECKIINYKL